MVNLRMIGLASALFLLLPAGVAANQILDAAGQAGFEVTNLVVANLPQSYQVNGTSGDFTAREQLVEGHTVFAVLEVVANLTPNPNGTYNVTGEISCDKNVQAEGPVWDSPFGPVTIPGKVDHASAECQFGETVIATPDPFGTGDMHLAPTGRVLPFESPDGQQAYAEEFQYDAQQPTPDGGTQTVTRYAWTTPILHPWTDADGKERDFVLPLPIDRLEAMGTTHFHLTPYHSP